ncbi:uncharacterized protein [Aegilops tauschii subsp. strangulata]|uniref:uncharacterized protein isoform X1 n=1 Tax=Aegilops tauschii subsp. strangulata TaxID=200361 RepID=UPI00098AC240
MVLSVSSLASAFSHLSLPSTSAPHPLPLVRLHPTTRHAAHPVLSASGADAAEQVEAEAPSADDGPEEVLAVEAEEDTLSGLAPRKYVKQRSPTQLRPLPYATALLPRPRRRVELSNPFSYLVVIPVFGLMCFVFCAGCSDLIWTSCCCSCRLMTRSHGCSLLLLLQPHDLVWCSATKSVFLYLKTPCSVVRCLLAGRSLIIFHPEQEKIISPYHLYMNPKLAVQHYEICYSLAVFFCLPLATAGFLMCFSCPADD